MSKCVHEEAEKEAACRPHHAGSLRHAGHYFRDKQAHKSTSVKKAQIARAVEARSFVNNFDLRLIAFRTFLGGLKVRTDKPQGEFSDPKDQESLQKLREDFSNQSGVPSVSELYQAAAILAKGMKPHRLRDPQIVRHALNLWMLCAEARTDYIDIFAKATLRANKRIEARIKATIPSSYPVSFDECLRFLMPQTKRPEDRMKLYREHVRESLRVQIYMDKYFGGGLSYSAVPIPTDEEVAKIIAKHKEEGFTEPLFATIKEYFSPWFLLHQKEKLKKRGQSGARAKWKKKHQPNAK